MAAANGDESLGMRGGGFGRRRWLEGDHLACSMKVSRSRIVVERSRPGLRVDKLQDSAAPIWNGFVRTGLGTSVVGIRRSFEIEPSDFPERAEVIAGVKLVARFGYKFELVLFERSLESALRLIQACPETEFILDHAGKPRIREGIDQPWKRNISGIAKHETWSAKYPDSPPRPTARLGERSI